MPSERLVREEEQAQAPYPIPLRPCYPMSGTDLQYAPTTLYAMSGTDLAYATTRLSYLRPLLRWTSAIILRTCYAIVCCCQKVAAARREMGEDVSYPISLRACYAMSGTHTAYAATEYHPTGLLCDVRY
eukprot:3182939-Rhodomonas_salina.1